MGLLDILFGKKPQPSGGLLNVPSGTTQQRYKDYAEQAMVKGEPVLPFAEWQKQQQAQASTASAPGK